MHYIIKFLIFSFEIVVIKKRIISIKSLFTKNDKLLVLLFGWLESKGTWKKSDVLSEYRFWHSKINISYCDLLLPYNAQSIVNNIMYLATTAPCLNSLIVTHHCSVGTYVYSRKKNSLVHRFKILM